MKNLLISLIGVTAIATVIPSVVFFSQTTTKNNGNHSFLINYEKDINKIIWQSKGNYFYNYKIYISHDNLNNWNNFHKNKLLFELKVGNDLRNFESNTTVNLLETHILSSDLYQIWIKDKVMSYDHNQGVILKLEYSRYSLQSVTISSQ